MPSNTIETLERGTEEGQFVCVNAQDLLHGHVRISQENGGWRRPWRFSSNQVRSMGSCVAWHPGLFRQMARTTAGVTLQFETDSTEIAIELQLDAEPSGSRTVLDYVRGEDALPLDGVSVDVDGRHLPCVMPVERDAILRFALDDPDEAPLPGLVMLPGFGEKHQVRVWLPALRGCAVRRLWGNGSAIEPVGQRNQLLVIGDSIAQGFVTGDPALSWPATLAGLLGLDLVNQGLGGQVFQPGFLFGLAAHVNPSVLVIALGENYRYEPCHHRPTARDIRSYLMEVTRLWPDVPTYVCTPLWHDEETYPSHAMSCWQRVPSMIAANAAVHDQMMLVDGLRLMDHDRTLLADGYEHPNAEGATQTAYRLFARMRLEGQHDEEALRAVALHTLERAPQQVFPLVEILRRGIGRVTATEGGTVVIDVGDGRVFAYAANRLFGEAVLALQDGVSAVALSDSALERGVAKSLGLTERKPFHVLAFRRKARPKVPATKDIRPLDDTFAEVILSHLGDETSSMQNHLLSALGRGDVLGGFEGDELVGVIGVLPEGSLTAPVVFENGRQKGWIRALLVAKICQQLDLGQVPWCEIYSEDAGLLDTLKKLGFQANTANEQVFLYKQNKQEELA